MIATVTGAASRPFNGKVIALDGKKKLGARRSRSGKAVFNGKQLKVGKHKITVVKDARLSLRNAGKKAGHRQGRK